MLMRCCCTCEEQAEALLARKLCLLSAAGVTLDGLILVPGDKGILPVVHGLWAVCVLLIILWGVS